LLGKHRVIGASTPSNTALAPSTANELPIKLGFRFALAPLTGISLVCAAVPSLIHRPVLPAASRPKNSRSLPNAA
jgi:hypothetical protein